MEIQDKFGRMSEFSCEYPRGFLVCAFVTHPPDQVQQFTGTTSVIDLGIQDFGDFELRFVIYHDGRRGGLSARISGNFFASNSGMSSVFGRVKG